MPCVELLHELRQQLSSTPILRMPQRDPDRLVQRLECAGRVALAQGDGLQSTSMGSDDLLSAVAAPDDDCGTETNKRG
ncbi:MAG: hypothetical protein ACRD2C_25245 [Acidimicrobiales bacterium]